METSQDCLDDDYLMEQLSLRQDQKPQPPEFGSSIEIKHGSSVDVKD